MDGLPAEETPSKAHFVILVDSVYRSSKSCYPQVILEECGYMVKNETTKIFLTEKFFDSDLNFNFGYDS